MVIAEKYNTVKSIHQRKKQIVKEEMKVSRPDQTDLDMIPIIYDSFNEVANPNNKDNIKMFIFLVFWMYSPLSCVGRTVRGSVRRRIAKLLKVSNSAISVQFGDAKVLFEKHCGFRKETERLYQCLMSLDFVDKSSGTPQTVGGNA